MKQQLSTKFRRNEQGQTMVEFALVLPLLMTLLLAILQFGIVFNNYLTLTDAVRVGARKAAVSRTDPNRVPDSENAVESAATDLSPRPTLNVTVTSGWNPGDDVTVTASYPYSINILGIVVKSGRFTSTTTERVE
jgi:Flp pilus assembly protein TadG